VWAPQKLSTFAGVCIARHNGLVMLRPYSLDAVFFTACSGEIETGMLSHKRFEKRGKGVINRVGMEQTQLERAFSAQQYSERMLWKNVFSIAPLPRASRYKRKCRRKSKTRTKPCIRFSSDTYS
jgi:hypothetical protein